MMIMGRGILILILLLGGMHCLKAQPITGIKQVPGDYNTLADAVTALNTHGVGGGGAEIRVLANQNAPAGGYRLGSATLNGSLSAANSLLIHGKGNTVTAYEGTGSTDGIFLLLGTDYVTIDSLHLQERPQNSNDNQRMEWGYALLRRQSARPYDGCQHVTIRNCSIRMGIANSTAEVYGIYSAAHVADNKTALAYNNLTPAISDEEKNKFCKFYKNRISGCKAGIRILGLGNNTSANIVFWDAYYEIDENEVVVGYNSNLSGAPECAGIFAAFVETIIIRNNRISTSDFHTSTFHGIILSTSISGGTFLAASGITHIAGNSIRYTKAAPRSIYIAGVRGRLGFGDSVSIVDNTIKLNNFISNNHHAAIEITTSDLRKIVCNNNQIDSIHQTAGTGLTGAIWLTTGNTLNVEVLDNRIASLSKAGTNTVTTGIKVVEVKNTNASGSVVVKGNQLSNIRSQLTNGESWGFEIGSQSAKAFLFSNNSIKNFSVSDACDLTGVASQNGGVYHFENNVLDSFSNDQGILRGFFVRGDTVRNNVLQDFYSNGGKLYGFQSVGQTSSSTVSANIQGNRFLKFANAGQGTGVILRGIDFNSLRRASTAINNVIELHAGKDFSASGASFSGFHAQYNPVFTIQHNTLRITRDLTGSPTEVGATGIWLEDNGCMLKSNNNIIHLEVAPAGTGSTFAIFRKSTAAPTAANFDVDGNVYYVPEVANSFIYGDNQATNNRFGLLNDPAFNKHCSYYKTFMRQIAKEQNSYYEDNLAFSQVNNTWAPSGSSFARRRGVLTNTSGLSVDIVGVSRPNPGSDIGAIQFAGYRADSVDPEISFVPLSPFSCDTASPVLKTIIKDDRGIETRPGAAPRLYYRKLSEQNNFGLYPTDNNSGFNGWKYVEAKASVADTFYFQFDYGKLTGPIAAGDEIEYFVVAQDRARNVDVYQAEFANGFCFGGVNLIPSAGPLSSNTSVNRFQIQDQQRKELDPAGQVYLCGGSPTLLKVPEAGVSHLWYRNDTIINGANAATYGGVTAGRYFAFVNTAGCFYTTTVTELVQPTSPVLKSVGSTSICSGVYVILHTDSSFIGRTYSWLKDNVLISGHSYASCHAREGGDYQVITTTNGCNDTSNIITVIKLPNPPTDLTTTTGDTTFCEGNTLTLVAPAGQNSYRWSRDGNVFSGPSSVNTIEIDRPGLYKVIITGNNFCRDSSDALELKIDSVWATIAQPASLTFCAGDSILLSADPYTGYSYSWLRNGILLPGRTRELFVNTNGDYQVVATNANHCTDTSFSVSVVSDFALATIHIVGPSEICEGDTARLVSHNLPNYSFDWFRNGLPVPGIHGNVLLAGESGDFHVVAVTNNGCMDTSPTVTVTVNSVPHADIHLDGDSIFCAGNISTLYTTATAYGYYWQWRVNGMPIDNANDSFYTVPASGMYDVVVSSGFNCNDTSSAREITVLHPPVPGIIAVDPRMKAEGDYVTYQWYRNDVAVDGATDSLFTATDTGSYLVEVTDSFGCAGRSLVYHLKTMNFVDVEDIASLSAEIVVFPNPASTVIHAKAPVPVSMELYAMDGKLVTKNDFDPFMSVDRIPSGVYIVRILTKDGTPVKHERLIIDRVD